MRKYTWNYFCSLFPCTAVSAKSDCRDTDWQAVVWPWRASISRIIGLLLALTSQSRPLFKPTYEDERLPYTTLNNIALLLCLLYIAAPMNDRCTRIFNIAYRPNLWVAVTSSHGLLVAVNFLQWIDFVNVVLCDELTSLVATSWLDWCDERCNGVTGTSIRLLDVDYCPRLRRVFRDIMVGVNADA